MVSNKQQFFCFKCGYEFIKAMPEAINDGRRNVHHLFRNRQNVISRPKPQCNNKKKVSPEFSARLMFFIFSKEIRLLFYLEK